MATAGRFPLQIICIRMIVMRSLQITSSETDFISCCWLRSVNKRHEDKRGELISVSARNSEVISTPGQKWTWPREGLFAVKDIFISDKRRFFSRISPSLAPGWHFIQAGNLYSSRDAALLVSFTFRGFCQDSIIPPCVSWSLSTRATKYFLVVRFLWYEMKSSNHRDEIFVESFIVGIMPAVINGTSLASKCKTGFLNQLRARSCLVGDF